MRWGFGFACGWGFGFACGVGVVAGSVVLLRLKKVVPILGDIIRDILRDMFPLKKTIQENRDNLRHRLGDEVELPHLELWVLLNRLGRHGKPVEQALVVIENQTLQKLNNCKWVSSSLKQLPSYVTPTNPRFFQVNPSMQGHSFRAVCDDFSIYLIGGYDKEDAYCINATKVVFGKTTEEEAPHSRQLSPMQVRNRVVGAAAVTNEKRVYAFGRLQCVYDDSDDDDHDSSSFGEMYDIKDNSWMPFEDVPFKDAPRCTVLGCVMWDSKIVLFLQKQEKEKEVVGAGKLRYKQVTRVSFYDLKMEGWISTDVIEEDQISINCFLVLAGDHVFIVQSSALYRYKRITGINQGLQQMEELTHNLGDVVYLGSSDDKRFLKFCIFWEGFVYPEKFMHFAFMKVGDDGGDKLTVSFSLSVGSIPIKIDDYIIKCTHVITQTHHVG